MNDLQTVCLVLDESKLFGGRIGTLGTKIGGPTPTTTRRVPTDYPTLQAALNDSTASGDTIIVESIYSGPLTGTVTTDFLNVEAERSGIALTLADGIERVLIANSAFGIAVTGNGLDNTLDGSVGNDSLSGLGGNDTFVGGLGDDTLLGGDGNDRLGGVTADNSEGPPRSGNDGSDSIDGGAGSDNIDAGVGDTAMGGSGDDTINVYGDSLPTLVDGGADSDTVYLVAGTSASVTLAAGSFTNVEATLIQQAGIYDFSALTEGQSISASAEVTVTGTAGNDIVTGSFDADSISGGAGNDQIDGGGGSGTDTLTGGAGSDVFAGTRPQIEGDVITDIATGESILIRYQVAPPDGPVSGDLEPNFTAMLQGDTLVIDTNGSDTMYGGGDKFTLTLQGAAGGSVTTSFDEATGIARITYTGANTGDGPGEDGSGGDPDGDGPAPTSGPDRLTGSTDGETIAAGGGADTVRALGGPDLIYGNQGADVIYAGDGPDTVYGGQDDDRISGGEGRDVIYGNVGDDKLYGGEDRDFLYGGQGDDYLNGEDGPDVLVGGAGDDTLRGGEGADRYVFQADAGARDFVLGFSTAEGDRLDLGGQDYTVTTAANGDVVLALSGGGQVQLAGVTAQEFGNGAGYFVG